MSKFFEFKNLGDGTTEIDIFNKVIGWDVYAGEFKQQLDLAAKSSTIVLNINSPGGVITEGMAIYALLRQYSEKLTIRVYGVAASIASVIALAGSKMEMMEGSMFMIHDPFIAGFIEGNAEELESMADALKKMKKQICNVYMRKTGKSEEEINAWMSAETWFTAEEAIEAGFADAVVETYKAAACHEFPTAINKDGLQKYISLHKAEGSSEPTSTSTSENTAPSGQNELLLKVEELLTIAKAMQGTLATLSSIEKAPGSNSGSAEPSAHEEPNAEPGDFLSLLAKATQDMKTTHSQGA